MAYDPFVHGPHAFNERDGTITDRARDRALPYTIWSPDASRPVPLIVFSHTSGGHRRQSSFLTSHLASHGYAVAAVDHVGSTFADAAERRRRAEAGDVMTGAEIDAFVARIIADRVPDLRFLIDAVLNGTAGDISERVDKSRIGLLGYSFGGWAVLATPEVDDRITAIVAMAPGGNSKPLPGIIPAQLTFAWKRDVATLFLVAERDRFTPLAGQYELLERAPGAKRLFILKDADHGHFADDITDPGTPSEDAHLFARGLTLAHFDATLRGHGDAEEFFARALDALRDNGVDAASTASRSSAGRSARSRNANLSARG